MDRLFTDFGRLSDIRENGSLAPAIDLQETEDEIVVKATMPGIKSEDIEVKVAQNTLTIRGESREAREETQGTWHTRERRMGSVYRSMTLPSPVSEDRAEATMSDGVLKIRLPKSGDTTGKRIEVKTS